MMTRNQIIEELKTRLASEFARPFDLHLFEDGIRQEDDWWYVPVSSGIADANAFQYSPILNRIEEEFETQGTKLLLIPALN